jgi:hypothetical protein
MDDITRMDIKLKKSYSAEGSHISAMARQRLFFPGDSRRPL